MSDTTWARYRHREKPEIEYEVEARAASGEPIVQFEPTGSEPCHRIRTIKNHGHYEEAHQPAFTYMPADKFTELYGRVA